MPSRKYTKQVLEPAAQGSVSLAGVMRVLGIRWSSSTQALIARRIKEYGIDTSHFTGQGSNRGEQHRGGPSKKPWQEILVRRTEGRETPFRLRRAMIEAGIPYQCAECKGGPEWRGRALLLQVDHRDRNYCNNEPKNVRFLCPNCHSQTEGWSQGKGLTGVTDRAAQSRALRERRKSSSHRGGTMADTAG